jgi:uncharacterized LabA/DUF88 family protein
MTLRDEAPKVAVYWDFENLHAIIANVTHGENAYRENRFTPQPVFVEIEPILEYAASLGDVIINRAYGNWQWFANYRETLNRTGIDLIQMFPRGQNMKNSADIRMALDALTDVYTHPHLTHVVIVSSDSDFISLSQKIKQAGRFVAGIGMSGFSNRFWISSCNEFKFYQNLSSPVVVEPQLGLDVVSPTADALEASSSDEFVELSGLPSFEEAKDALHRATKQLVERKGENYVARSAVKVILKRLLPSFDENALGCQNFSEFVSRCPDVVRIVDNLSGGHVELTNYVASNIQAVAEAPIKTILDDVQISPEEVRGFD